MAERSSGTPRWVKVFGAIAIVVFVLFLALMLFGGGRHGPGRHMRSSGAGADATPTLALEDTPLRGGHW